ncbi:MAG: hypothetical protein CMJ49_03280 [Planctomycetaceae bacterium]|nr:hypothetical protein [Planctomycetaceae bacterium]
MARARKAAKHLAPVPLGLEPSFGYGDRIGLATPGHVAATHSAGGGILPIFAQQSIREMTRTGRSAQGVMDDALFGVLLAGYSGKHGADADHLKTPADVEVTAAAGYVFFTIDPSDYVDGEADDYPTEELLARFARIAGSIGWVEAYQGKSVTLSTGAVIEFTEEACCRAAVKYGRAIEHTIEIARHIEKTAKGLKQKFEIELSVDETPQPTTLAEHYIIADQVQSGGLKHLVSLAPRFIGDLEKGVDYKGDVAALEVTLKDHAAIAEKLGPYKLSLHSGSDKLSMYTPFARATGGRFHVKTAGTSYLEALRVVLRHDEALFRRIVDFGRERYDVDKATYHVAATLDSAPPQDEVSDTKELERLYLECWEDVPAGKGFTALGRQILHCTFGSVLTDAELGRAVRAMLEAYPETYAAVLEEHFVRHLDSLRAGM